MQTRDEIVNSNPELLFTPRQLGILDALDAWKPVPSACDNITTSEHRVEYLDGYLKHCHHQPDHAQSARHLLSLYSPEQAEAEATAERVLDALWKVTNDEL